LCGEFGEARSYIASGDITDNAVDTNDGMFRL
jgi:hypothetical protein